MPIHGQPAASRAELTIAGAVNGVADAGAVATVGLLYASLLLCGRGGWGRALVTPVAWRLQRGAGLLAAVWAVTAFVQIPFGLARLIRQPVAVAWNATYLYDYLTAFTPGRLQLLAAGCVVATAALARSGLRRATVAAATGCAGVALVAQTLSGAQFQPGSSGPRLALAVHVVSVAGWAGAALAAACLAQLGVKRTQPVLRRQARWAPLWVAAAGSTGLLLADADLFTPSALVTTWPGWLVVAKIAAFLAAIAVGSRIRSRLRATPTGTSSAMRRLVALEVAAFGWAVGVAAVLALS